MNLFRLHPVCIDRSRSFGEGYGKGNPAHKRNLPEIHIYSSGHGNPQLFQNILRLHLERGVDPEIHGY